MLDKLNLSQKRRIQTHTQFIDAAHIAQFTQALAGEDATAYGGYEGAERQIIIFNNENTPTITPLAISFNEKFTTSPSHRDYLGAVLGLGLERTKIGDIRLGKNGAIMYVLEDVADFIAAALTQVGRVSVKVHTNIAKIDIEEVITERRITVPSMRLDAVVSGALNISRGKAAALIEADRVFVNWKETKKTKEIAVGDKITVRGIGRVEVSEVAGSTKKERIVLLVRVSK